MDKKFFADGIIKDRKERQYLDFGGEEWFEKFRELKDTEVTIGIGGEILDAFEELGEDCECKKKFSQSKEVMEILCSVRMVDFKAFMLFYKEGKFGSWKIKHCKEELHDENIPLVRFMDFLLERGEFERLLEVVDKLEYRYFLIWVELSQEEIKQTIQENIHNPNLLFLFAMFEKEEFTKFFEEKYLPIMENAPVEAIEIMLKKATMPEKYIWNDYYFKNFKRLRLFEQVDLIERMEAIEYSFELISELHRLLNKETAMKWHWSQKVFEMTEEKLRKMRNGIESSSYFARNGIQDTDSWKKLNITEKDPIDPEYDYYSEIGKLYAECRSYATNSIVSSLYPLSSLTQKVTHLYGESFNMLVRVRTGELFEAESLKDTFKIRTFCSFSIINEKNLSHYSSSDDVLYGYYTGVSADLIAHIYPMDSLSSADARYESKLTKLPNMLLDIRDLNKATIENKTYNQLCVRTKTKSGKILWPDCIVCINEISEKSWKVAEELQLKIIVIHKQKGAIEYTGDIYKHL